MIKFYDTNAVLLLGKKIIDGENFMLSSTTLEELELIKTDSRKDQEIKYKARKCLHILDDNPTMLSVIVVNTEILDINSKFGMPDTPDNRICACAYYASLSHDINFITNDIACKTIAKWIFGLNVNSISDIQEDYYKGYIEKTLSDEEMADFYSDLSVNKYELLTNQYLILKDKNENAVDKFKWTGEEYQNLKFPTIKSTYFGVVKPYNGDIYQQMVLNSLSSNQVTMIKGAAGTGKSYLAIGYMMWLLEKRKIDKIVIFCNTVATANSAKLGYYPGSKDEKLLDSAIGNMLSAKLGDSFALEKMIQQGEIALLPMSDIRGFDTSGMNCAVYITEKLAESPLL